MELMSYLEELGRVRVYSASADWFYSGPLLLASFSIDVTNYFDKYNLRENGFILTHSSGYCPSWWRGEGKKKVKAEHAISVLRE